MTSLMILSCTLLIDPSVAGLGINGAVLFDESEKNNFSK
jgi:hypothetical protein